MSIITGLMNLGKNATVSLAKKGVVETQKVLQGKTSIKGINLGGLLRSPQADTFISSATKQNAKILSDNIVRFEGSGMPYRVITKRLPSGTTIAQSFDLTGKKVFKEVITKEGVAHSYTSPISGDVACATYNYVTGTGMYKSMHAKASQAGVLVSPLAQGKDAFLSNAMGLTKLSNANNADYQNLKKMGLVY